MGRFILYSIRDPKVKRFYLVFPKGRGILRGWVLLANKLRSLGVVTPFEDKVGSGTIGVKEGRRGEV